MEREKERCRKCKQAMRRRESKAGCARTWIIALAPPFVEALKLIVSLLRPS